MSAISTTIIAVRRDEDVAMAGDGQVTIQEKVVKHSANKLRRLYENKILAGFAGAAADAFALFTRFEGKLQEHAGNLERSAVELVKEWRTDKVLRRLEAFLLVADREKLFLLSGDGDLLEPDGGIAAIGSGGSYAQAAATALLQHTDLPAAVIAEEALRIAASLCIYTNDHILVETL